MFNTIEDIIDAHTEAGGYFFEYRTMDGFNSRVLNSVFQIPGGALFVTSERPRFSTIWGGKRRYTVRIAWASGRVATYQQFAYGEFHTRRAALSAARNEALRLNNPGDRIDA